MPGTFTYTRSTNTLVVTDGTSGSPADFASMLTADRAGSVELKAATAGAKAMTLTYQIAPAELRALQISFIVASKTAETDYILITGTDFRGNALVECIDVSAGNGTYVSSQYFATITNIDCEDVGDGSGTAWADGTVQVTQPQWGVVWNPGTGQYRIGCNINFGDSSTSTYFYSTREQIYFITGVTFSVKSSATFTSGVKSADGNGDNGSSISVEASGHVSLCVSGGTFNFYGGQIIQRKTTRRFYFYGDADICNSQLFGSTNGLYFITGSHYLSRITVGGFGWSTFSVSPLLFNLCAFFDAASWGVSSEVANTSIRDLLCYATSPKIIAIPAAGVSGYSLQLVNPLFDVESGGVSISNVSGVIFESYSVNITVVDDSGSPIETALVNMTNAVPASVISDAATDAAGEITEQIVVAKQWYGTSETLTGYSPFILTISKSGYQTLVIPAITIDAPIDWTIELQPAGTANMSRVRVGH